MTLWLVLMSNNEVLAETYTRKSCFAAPVTHFLGKVNPASLLNSCFCFAFPSVEADGKTTKPVIENLTPYLAG